ncbi:unnamed protein product [Brassica oleracea]
MRSTIFGKIRSQEDEVEDEVVDNMVRLKDMYSRSQCLAAAPNTENVEECFTVGNGMSITTQELNDNFFRTQQIHLRRTLQMICRDAWRLLLLHCQHYRDTTPV